MLLPPMPVVVVVVVVRLHRMHSIDADYSYVRCSVVCLSVRVSVRWSRPRVSAAKWLNRSRCRVGCKLCEPKHEGTNYWMGLHVPTGGRGILGGGGFSSIAKHCRIPVCCNGTSVSPATTAEMVDVYAVGRDKLVWACALAPHGEYDGSVLRRLRCCLP